MDVPTRYGGQPNESIQKANAQGKTVVGASAPSQWRSWTHLGLGLLEFVPVPLVSGAAGAVDAGMYVQEGNYGDAALAAGSVIPFEKWAAAGAKGVEAVRAARAAEDAEKAAKAAKEAKEAEEAEKAAKEAKDGESVEKDKEKEGEDCSQCAMYPVVLHSGAKINYDIDFALPGVLTIELVRSYASDMGHDGPLGRNRIGSLDEVLTLDADGTVLYRMATGRKARFERPSPNPGAISRASRDAYLVLSVGRRGSFFLRDRGVIKHFTKGKDGVWHIAEIRDLNDHQAVFTRDAAGSLTRLDRSDGFAFTFENDAAGRRTAATLHAPGSETRLVLKLAYDGRGNLASVRNAHAPSLTYEYDARNRLIAYDDGVKVRCEYVYDEADRVVVVKTPGGTFDHTISYEPSATTLAYSGRPEASTRYEFDAHGKTLRETNGLGHVKLFERNDAGIVLAEIDAEGHRTSYGRDAFGNLSTVTDPEGRRTTYVYDVDGRLERLIDAAGNAWEWSYDPRGNLVSVQDPLGYRTDIVSDAAGQPTAVMRHDGLIEHRRYDGQNRLVRLVDYRGGATVYQRDAFGRVVAQTDPLGHVSRFAYEERPGADFWTAAAMTRPDGVTLTRAEEPERALLTKVDGDGHRAVYRYGPFDLLAEVEDPQGGRLRFTYDHEQRLIRVVNPIDRSWTFERDPAGRVVRETDFDGFAIDFVYDKADRILEQRFPDGSRIAYSYDRSSRLVNLKAWNAGAEKPDKTVYWHDERGLLAGSQNDQARITLRRDGLGRVTDETCNGRAIRSTYDCCGNRTARQIGDRLVSTDYDPLGAPRQISIADHAPLAFAHDGNGREVRRENGTGFLLQQTWDSVGQLQSQSHGAHPMGGPSVDEPIGIGRVYDWAHTSAPARVRDGRWGETSFAYDANGQVTEAVHGDGRAERFDYDLALNIKGSSSDTARLASWLTGADGLVAAAVGPLGERISLSRDARGRVVERKVERRGFRPKSWRYTWDARDRLVGCETPAGERWIYGYDPFGRRISRTRSLNDQEQAWVRTRHPGLLPPGSERSALDVWPAPPPGAEPTGERPPVAGRAYLWDGDIVAEEAPLRLDGAIDWSLATSWHYEPGSFRPLAKEEPDGRLLHVVTDHLGTPRELVDEQGRPVWAAEQNLWGGLRRVWTAANDNAAPEAANPRGGRTWGALALRDDPEAIEATAICPIRFLGQWEDEETGLCYNRLRQYDPLTGAYLSRDPIGMDGGLRTYGYVWSPPIQADPLGLAPTAYQMVGSRLCIVNKFPSGSPESNELNDFTNRWNTAIDKNGGSMTTRTLTQQEQKDSSAWKKKQRRENPDCCKGGKVAGHVPDAAAGGPAVPPSVMWQNPAVNGYVGGIVGSLPVGTTYTGVYTASSLAGC